MHRQMIAAVNTLLTSVGDASYPKVEGLERPLPAPARCGLAGPGGIFRRGRRNRCLHR